MTTSLFQRRPGIGAAERRTQQAGISTRCSQRGRALSTGGQLQCRGMSVNQRRVLVVEDERTIAESVAARLRAEGFAADLAHDGPSAVTVAAATQPDLGVLDI